MSDRTADVIYVSILVGLILAAAMLIMLASCGDMQQCTYCWQAMPHH